jgi:polysaccharide chain length determinant protein (PEP-CTERM system associated)
MQQESKQLTFHDLFRIVTRRKWLIVFCILGVGAAGTFFSFAIPESYRASTVFLVKDPQFVASVYGGALVGVPFERRLSSIEEDVQAFQSITDVVEDLGLARNGRSVGQVATEILRDLEVRVVPTRRADTTVVLAYTDTSPGRAANVVNWVRDRYIADQVEAYREDVKKVVDRLQEQIDRQKATQEQLSEDIQKFEEKHLFDVVTRTSKSQQDLARIERDLEKRQSLLEAKKNELLETQRALKTTDRVLTPQEKQRNKRYDDLLEKLIRKKQDVDLLEELYTESYEPLRIARAELRNLEESLAQMDEFLIVQQEKKVNQEYLDLQQAERRLNAEIAGLENGIKESDREARLLRITVRDLPRQRAQWSQLNENYQQVSSAIAETLRQKARADLTWEVAREAAGTHFEVIDPARPPLSPAGPNRLLWFLGSIGAGLAVGLGISVLLFFLSQALTTVEEARSFLGVPVMGTVPTIRSALEVQRDRRRRAMALAVVMVLVFSGAAFTLLYMEFPEVLPGFVRDSISTLRERMR